MLVDSGAANHLIRDRSVFKDLVKVKGSIRTATGESVGVHLSGRVEVETKKGSPISFSNVLHCSELDFDLLGVSQLVDSGCEVVFSKVKSYIRCPDGRAIEIERNGKVFELNLKTGSPSLGGQ